mgnify:CR=1 FL=1
MIRSSLYKKSFLNRGQILYRSPESGLLTLLKNGVKVVRNPKTELDHKSQLLQAIASCHSLTGIDGDLIGLIGY